MLQKIIYKQLKILKYFDKLEKGIDIEDDDYNNDDNDNENDNLDE